MRGVTAVKGYAVEDNTAGTKQEWGGNHPKVTAARKKRPLQARDTRCVHDHRSCELAVAEGRHGTGTKPKRGYALKGCCKPKLAADG